MELKVVGWLTISLMGTEIVRAKDTGFSFATEIRRDSAGAKFQSANFTVHSPPTDENKPVFF